MPAKYIFGALGFLLFIIVIVGIVIPASRDATLDFVQKKKNGMNSKNLHNAQIFNIVESIMQQLLDIQNRKIIVCPKTGSLEINAMQDDDEYCFELDQRTRSVKITVTYTPLGSNIPRDVARLEYHFPFRYKGKLRHLYDTSVGLMTVHTGNALIERLCR